MEKLTIFLRYTRFVEKNKRLCYAEIIEERFDFGMEVRL